VWILWIRAMPKTAQPIAAVSAGIDAKDDVTVANHVG
jgi:hypothetical protein